MFTAAATNDPGAASGVLALHGSFVSLAVITRTDSLLPRWLSSGASLGPVRWTARTST